MVPPPRSCSRESPISLSFLLIARSLTPPSFSSFQGLWLGYGTTTFPEVTEALTLNKDVHEAQVASERVASLLEAMAERLEV